MPQLKAGGTAVDTVRMKHTDCTPSQPGRHASLAWLLGVIASIGFFLVLAVSPRHVEGAPADPGPGPVLASTTALEEENEDEEAAEDTEGEEAVVIIEEFEEPEEFEEGASEGAGRAEQCQLRTATAHAIAKRGTLKLTIGYGASEPVNARIEVRKGGRRIASARRHLNESGVLRFRQKLRSSQAAKLDAGDRISVALEVIGTASNCSRVGSLSPRLVLLPR